MLFPGSARLGGCRSRVFVIARRLSNTEWAPLPGAAYSPPGSRDCEVRQAVCRRHCRFGMNFPRLAQAPRAFAYRPQGISLEMLGATGRLGIHILLARAMAKMIAVILASRYALSGRLRSGAMIAATTTRESRSHAS